MNLTIFKDRKFSLYFIFFLSILLGSIKNPALKMLIDHDKFLSIKYPGAISFCNVLFVGTFCSGAVTFFVMGPLKILQEVRNLKFMNVLLLCIASITQVTYVSLLFFILEKASVVEVVLLGQLKGIFYIILAYLFIHITVKGQELWGYAVIFLGILILILNSGISTSKTTWLMLIGIFFSKLTDIIDKKLLEECSEGVILVVENIIGAMIFYSILSYYYGPQHFADAFTGELWILMVIYAGIAVVISDILWLKATKRATPQMIANSILLDPFFTISMAFLFLGEIPTRLETVVFGIIILGLAITKIKGQPRPVNLERICGVTPAKI